MFEQGQANPAIQPVLAPLRHADLTSHRISTAADQLPDDKNDCHCIDSPSTPSLSKKSSGTRRPGTSRRRTTKWKRCPGVIRTTNARSTPCTATTDPARGLTALQWGAGGGGTPRDLSAMLSTFGDQAQNPTAKRAVQFRNGPWMPGRWSKPRLQLEFRPPSASRLTPNTPPEPASGASGKAAQASAPV